MLELLGHMTLEVEILSLQPANMRAGVYLVFLL